MTLHIGKLFYQRGSTKLTVGQLLYSTRDIKYITRFFGMIVVLATTAHSIILGTLIFHTGSAAFKTVTTPSSELAQLGCFCSCVVLFHDLGYAPSEPDNEIPSFDVFLRLYWFYSCQPCCRFGSFMALAGAWVGKWQEESIGQGSQLIKILGSHLEARAGLMF